MNVIRAGHRRACMRRLPQLLAVIVVAVTSARDAAAIIYGTPTTAYPSVVEVGYAEPFQPYCSGTVIAPRTVLTAAHCAEGEEPTALAIRVGGRVVRVHDARLHPRFEWPLYDVALLYLADDAGVMPMAIARDRVGSGPALVVGNGITEDDTSDGRTRCGVVRLDHCPRRDPDLRTSTCQYVQMGEPNACIGDSGGPVVTEAGIVGVASGYDYACDDGLSFNVDLGRRRIRRWIERHVDDAR